MCEVKRNSDILGVEGGVGREREKELNTLRTGDADLRFYVTTVQDG